MKLSDNTAISMPMRNLISILAAVGIGVWSYFGIIGRLTNIETQGKLMIVDVEKNTEFRIKWPRGEMGALPADQSQDMLMQEMQMMMSEIRLVSDVANELKNDLRTDVRRVESIVNDVEQQVKEDSRDNAKDLKNTIDTLEEDMKKLEEKIKLAQKELEEKIDKRIKRALENPLGG